MKLRIKPDPKIKNFLWPKYKTGGAAAFDLYLQEDISLRAEDVEVEHAARGDHSGSTGGNENIITK